jgi:hypothetical protein
VHAVLQRSTADFVAEGRGCLRASVLLPGAPKLYAYAGTMVPNAPSRNWRRVSNQGVDELKVAPHGLQVASSLVAIPYLGDTAASDMLHACLTSWLSVPEQPLLVQARNFCKGRWTHRVCLGTGRCRMQKTEHVRAGVMDKAWFDQTRAVAWHIGPKLHAFATTKTFTTCNQ